MVTNKDLERKVASE